MLLRIMNRGEEWRKKKERERGDGGEDEERQTGKRRDGEDRKFRRKEGERGDGGEDENM